MIIIVDKQGQLANRLFVFTSFIALCEESSVKVYYPGFYDYADYFSATSTGNLIQYPIKHNKKKLLINRINQICYHVLLRCYNYLEKLKIKETSWYYLHNFSTDNIDKFVAQLSINKFILCRGWVYTNKNRWLYREKVSNYFRLKPDLGSPVEAFYKQHLSNTEIILGVHIRRGDYETFLDGKYFYDFKTYKLYLTKLLSLIDSQKTIKILFSSNEVIPESFLKSFRNYVIAPGNQIIDLYLLSRCTHIIGPPSTYSMWASFIGMVPLFKIESKDSFDSLNIEDFYVVE